MKIFVIHYKKLIDRKAHILKQFEQFNITDYEFIEIDRDDLCGQNIDTFEPYYCKSQMAITLSHFYAYNEIRLKYDCGLIFEDDVILSDNFVDTFAKYVEDLPEDYDMLFIGNGCSLHIPDHKLIPNKNIYKKCVYECSDEPVTAGRCADSYLVSKKCAINICNYIDNLKYKINIPVDWWLNTAARDNDLQIYWSEPTIVTQGTQNGTFTSSH
jgi:glycosyl transferase family 25